MMQRQGRNARGTWFLGLGLLAFIILPFVVLGERLESWVPMLMGPSSAAVATAGVGMVLLASDIVLPVPSSLVLTALGAALGSLMGTLVGAAGLTAGCVLGYALGRLAGEAGATSLLQGARKETAPPLFEKYGLAFVVASRAVPVL